LYFVGQLFSLIGSWTQNTTLMWLAHEATHQAKWPAFLIAAQIGPTLFFGPWGGSLADRIPKRRLIGVTQFGFLLTALAILACYAWGWLDVWVMLALMVVHGFIQAVDLPARMAFVSDLVPRSHLVNAVALNSLLFNVARAVGPAFAGVLLSSLGPAACFGFNAFSYGAILVALAWMHLPPPQREIHDHSLVGGFRALRQRPSLAYLVAVAGVVAIGGWPLLALLPAYVEHRVRGSAENYTLLLSAVGMGALLAALTAARFANERSRRWFMHSGIGLVSVACVLLASTTALPWALVGCGLFGFGMILFFAIGQSTIQMGIDDVNRGKVMGIWAMVLSAGVPCGNLVFGPAADRWGVATVLGVEAVLIAAVALLFSAWRDHSTTLSEPTR
jgi:predicted MFS family arabinose efflux permease